MYMQAQMKGTLDGRLEESVHQARGEDCWETKASTRDIESMNGELSSVAKAC